MKRNLAANGVFIFLLIIISQQTHSQSTFSSVYSIFQTNCTASCHNANSVDGGLDLSGSLGDVYNQLVGQNPSNSMALSKGYKRVEKGKPYKSFLLRKINGAFDPTLDIDPFEGSSMPLNLPSLEDHEIEIVRQWILYGASMTDNVVDEQLIYDYYNGQGLAQLPIPAEPSDLGKEGRRLRIGPIFLAPGQEVEYFKKEDLNLNVPKDSYRQEVFMNWQSHHFALYTYAADQASTYPEGYVSSESQYYASVHFFGTQIGGWDSSRDIELPQGTAYKWNETTVLVTNYHVKNYSQDSILMADAYVNVYLQDQDPANEEMFMVFPNYGGFNPYILQIPPTGQEYSLEFEYFDPDLNEIWNVWRIQGHTHALGVDFDIYLRNPDGTRGDQIYEGKSNADHTFNQGFFDYAHAPIRTFEPFLSFNINDGVIMEATWLNMGPDTVGFGITTEDEMYAGFIQFTKSEITGIEDNIFGSMPITVSPNPAVENIKIQYEVESGADVATHIFDLTGKLVFEEHKKDQNKGEYFVLLNLEQAGIKPGVYFVRQTIGSNSAVQKIVVSR